MKPVRPLINNATSYLKDNKEELIYKINGFLIVTLIATLLVAWNVRSNNTISNETDTVDELEQIIDNKVTEVESFNILLSKKEYCYTDHHIVLVEDGDYKKVYPYVKTLTYLTMEKYNSTNSNKASTNDTKKINMSDLVKSDIGPLPYTFNHLFKLASNYRNNLHYSNFVKVSAVPRSGREITPFTFARARAPGSITLANYELNKCNIIGSLILGSLNLC